MKSVWSETVKIAERKPVAGDMAVDVAVIGAGMTGILTAWYLKQQGKHVIVLEADRIASGQTRNTTAKITSQHGILYQTLIKDYGKKQANLYARANESAIAAYQKLIEGKRISCHFEKVPSYLYSLESIGSLEQEAEAAASLGIKSYFTKACDLPMEVKGAVCFEGQAQFHPLEFIKVLADELTIYERTRVHSVKEHVLHTNRGQITAGQIVFATHYPFINIPGFYFVRQHQERSYVLALSGATKCNGMYYSVDKNGLSIRMVEDILLLGGGAHRTGENTVGGAYEYLREQAKRYYPDCREVARWSAQDCVTHDKLPFIGRFSTLRPYWFVATGFQKWGMTSAMLAAQIITDEICHNQNPYESLFCPQRYHWKTSLGNLLQDVGHSVKGLSKGFLHVPFAVQDKLPVGHGGIVRAGFRRYACYKDEQGKLHKISARCPHMGCELQWNPDELSWDCPCHGSRFDCNGRLLDNPAQVDKKAR